MLEIARADFEPHAEVGGHQRPIRPIQQPCRAAMVLHGVIPVRFVLSVELGILNATSFKFVKEAALHLQHLVRWLVRAVQFLQQRRFPMPIVFTAEP